MYSKAISKRKVALLTGLALVASLFFGLTTASEAVPTCTITGPKTEPSPVIAEGTRITFSVKCDANESQTIRTAVEVDNLLVARDVETVGANAGAFLDVVKDIFVKPTKVCVEVQDQRQCVTVPPAA